MRLAPDCSPPRKHESSVSHATESQAHPNAPNKGARRDNSQRAPSNLSSERHALHTLRSGNADEREREREHAASGVARGEAGLRDGLVDRTPLAR